MTALLFLPLAAFLPGCDRLFSQKGDEALGMAQEKEKEGDYQAAIQWYEASLDGTPRTAESDYSMALIYDDKLNNPIAALDHYQRYLELTPSGPHAADARSFADQDKFKLVNTLSNGNFMPQQDAARLKNQNFELQEDLTDARNQIASLRAEIAQNPGALTGSDPVPHGARTYEVQPGDTLSSISRMFYNTTARWRDIRDANIEKLGGSVRLKVGIVLVIPKE